MEANPHSPKPPDKSTNYINYNNPKHLIVSIPSAQDKSQITSKQIMNFKNILTTPLTNSNNITDFNGQAAHMDLDASKSDKDNSQEESITISKKDKI